MRGRRRAISNMFRLRPIEFDRRTDSVPAFEQCTSQFRFVQLSSKNPRLEYYALPHFLQTLVKVRSSNATSSIHRFKISFIPVHVKVFNRQAFLLNASDSMFITREHLFAWTFPRTTVAQKLIYHIVEPPKFGILQRRIEANRNRRIGVSSNFTQQVQKDSISQADNSCPSLPSFAILKSTPRPILSFGDYLSLGSSV